MRLPPAVIEALEDLSQAQVAALTQLCEWSEEVLGADVLKVSVGSGDPSSEKERELVYAKIRLEGALRNNRMVLHELQKIRQAANKRVASSTARSKKD